LVAAQGERLAALWFLLAATGMRLGEALALRWEDVDLETGVIAIRHAKTEAGVRHLHLAGPDGRGVVLAMLEAHRLRQAEERLRAGSLWHDTGLVFTSRVGTPLSPSNLARRDWRRLIGRAGIGPRRRHDLRHTAGTLALLETADPKAVQAMLGHASTSFFLRTYAHAMPGSAAKVGAAMAEVVGRAAGLVVKLTTKGNKKGPRRGGLGTRKPLSL
jgi:integrase